MTEFDANIEAILAKGASQWTNDEAKQIEKLMKEGHKESLKIAMVRVRGGEKPEIIEQQ